MFVVVITIKMSATFKRGSSGSSFTFGTSFSATLQLLQHLQKYQNVIFYNKIVTKH